MKSIHPTDKYFPIKMDVFLKCIEDISNGIRTEDIMERGSICQEHLIANTTETYQKNGFSVKLVFELNEKNETDIMVEEVIFYEDMDEWLDALSRINSSKK